MDSLITGLPQKEMAAMALGLAHRYITISPTLYVFDMSISSLCCDIAQLLYMIEDNTDVIRNYISL